MLEQGILLDHELAPVFDPPDVPVRDHELIVLTLWDHSALRRPL